MARDRLYAKKINKLIDTSLKHLIEEYREVDGQFGWHQYLGSNKVGNIANAQALLLFKYFQREFTDKGKVINTLIGKQAHLPEDASIHGGWSYISSYDKAPTTECTSWVLLALQNELPPAHPVLALGLEWLVKNHKGKDTKRDIGWGSTQDGESKIYASCLALRVIKYARLTGLPAFEETFRWLKNAQNYDGGWGDTASSASTVTHTAHALITLRRCGLSCESECIQKGRDWLIQNFDVKEMWMSDANGGLNEHMDIPHFFEGKRDPRRINYLHYSLPWAIYALIRCERLNSPQVFRAIKYLLDINVNGNWVHPYLERKKYYTIWSKHDALLVFHQLVYHSPSWSELKYMKVVRHNMTYTYNRANVSFFTRIMGFLQ